MKDDCQRVSFLEGLPKLLNRFTTINAAAYVLKSKTFEIIQTNNSKSKQITTVFEIIIALAFYFQQKPEAVVGELSYKKVVLKKFAKFWSKVSRSIKL